MANMIPLQMYKGLQQKRIDKLMSGTRRGKITAAKYMVLMLRKLSPRNTGKLLGSIRRQGNTVRVGASNPLTGFPYVHWINESPGYERVAYMKRWTGDTTKYPYSSAKHKTGKPRFATISASRTREHFHKVMVKNMRKSIRLEG